MKKIFTVKEFEKISSNNSAALFYFSQAECSVCKVLMPKLEELLPDKFPEMKLYYIDCIESKELAASHSVFTVPTILVYLDGKEFVRKSRNLIVDQFIAEIERPYQMMFS